MYNQGKKSWAWIIFYEKKEKKIEENRVTGNVDLVIFTRSKNQLENIARPRIENSRRDRGDLA